MGAELPISVVGDGIFIDRNPLQILIVRGCCGMKCKRSKDKISRSIRQLLSQPYCSQPQRYALGAQQYLERLFLLLWQLDRLAIELPVPITHPSQKLLGVLVFDSNRCCDIPHSI